MEEKKKLTIKEIIFNKQYRSIAILIFYFILFFFLIIWVRTPEKKIEKDKNDEKEINEVVFNGYELIGKNNYQFTYNVSLDDETYTYEGKRYNNKILFKLGETEYYKEDSIILMKQNENYILTDNPAYLIDYFDTELIEKLIKNAKLISKEENKYMISNSKTNQVLEDETTAFKNGENYIYLYYKNKNITKIVLDITDYSKYLGETYNKAEISLEYKDFDLIEDFKIEK